MSSLTCVALLECVRSDFNFLNVRSTKNAVKRTFLASGNVSIIIIIIIIIKLKLN